MRLNRTILEDEFGQGAAEYILLFGGVIVISILALLIYKSYMKNGIPYNSDDDMNTVRSCANV